MPEKIDSNAKAERYHDKWSQFEIRNDNLFHKKHDLEVVSNEKRNEKIKELYEDQSIGPGRGIEMFYHTVCQKHLAIRCKRLFEKIKSVSDDKNTTSCS